MLPMAKSIYPYSFIKGQMLQQSRVDSQRKNISRSLELLQTLTEEQQITNSLPALAYTVKLLEEHLQNIGASNNSPNLNEKEADKYLFEKFNHILTKFGKHDMSHLKKNQAEIMDDIWIAVGESQFYKRVRPDIEHIKESHRRSLNAKNQEGSNIIEEKVIQATQNRSFHISDLEPDHSLRSSQISRRSTIKKDRDSLRYSHYKNQQIAEQQPSKSQSEENTTINQYDELWSRIELFYREHNIDEAYKLTLEYLDGVTVATQIPPYRQNLIETIQLEYSTMDGFYQQFDTNGWVFDKEEKGVTLEYKVFEEEKQIAIRIHSQVEVPIENFIAIISQIDLMEEYVPFCYDSREQKVISRNQKIGTSKIYIPLLTDRETYFYAAGYNRMTQKKSIFLFSKTINEDTLYQEKYGFKVPQKSDYVRLEYKFFIVEYIPINKNKAKIRLASKVDMKMNYLPQFILNKSARTFAFDYFKNIVKKSSKFKGSAWEKKMKERPELYQFFRKKIDEYYQNQE